MSTKRVGDSPRGFAAGQATAVAVTAHARAHALRAALFQAWALACTIPAGSGVAVAVAAHWRRRHHTLLAAAARLQVHWQPHLGFAVTG